MSEYVHRLRSHKRSVVLDVLYELEAREEPIGESVSEAIIELIRHTDADIREKSIEVAAVHFCIQSAYPILLSMLEGSEHDQTVLTAVCDALGSMVVRGVGSKEESSRLLARTVRNGGLDPELRGAAYLALARINGRISTAEFAAASRDIDELDCDLDWVSTTF